ncbi:RNA polymerase sigma factor, partial [Actinomadura adrarensis]
PSISDDVQERPHEGDGARETPPGRPSDAPSGNQAPVSPQGEKTKRPETSSPSPSSPASPRPGELVVDPVKVELYGTKVGKIRLTASGGPVSWRATSTSSQLTVSMSEGDLAGGRSVDVTVTLATHLINLPGKATVNFTDLRTGTGREIDVVWGISIL